MNTHRMFAMTVLLVGVTCAIIQAQSKKIERTALPPAVEKTLAAESKGATIRGLSTEVEEGKRLYEAALTVNGHARSLEIDERGNLLETEDEVPMASVPPTVKAALTKAAGKGTIEKVETLTKKGKLVAYEADVKTGTKRSEIQVSPDGSKLAHPE
jgi:putative PepSY-like beta-lactamase-inhibitor